MKVSKWTPKFDPRYESPFLPIWVAIKNLPIHLHDRKSLLDIAQVFGKPIKLDATTENFGRPSLARVCVEVDISQPQITKFCVQNGEIPLILSAYYENVPHFCHECRGVGRHNHGCKFCTPQAQKNPAPKPARNTLPESKPAERFHYKAINKGPTENFHKGPIQNPTPKNTTHYIQPTTDQASTSQNISLTPLIPTQEATPIQATNQNTTKQTPDPSPPTQTQIPQSVNSPTILPTPVEPDEDADLLFHDFIFKECISIWDKHQPKIIAIPQPVTTLLDTNQSQDVLDIPLSAQNNVHFLSDEEQTSENKNTTHKLQLPKPPFNQPLSADHTSCKAPPSSTRKSKRLQDKSSSNSSPPTPSQ
ncbi:hypothetical protein DM860_013152 [Cuscuta australis]|uniref:Uncharacterized protein n=1 Tax=Cuscuta australis TaxID=267555 RepID=A0A328DAZ1_9ASTE|nr:hypothetical protein DM860_013152 [Cuscuta australis]